MIYKKSHCRIAVMAFYVQKFQKEKILSCSMTDFVVK